MGGDEQRVPFLIVQDHQSATSQDFSRAPDQPTWKKPISVDRLAMPIDIENWNRILSPLCVFFPQRSGPVGKSFCERYHQDTQKKGIRAICYRILRHIDFDGET